MDLNLITEEERARRLPIVTRLATAIAHRNGDPIMAATYVLSETTVRLRPKTEAQLDAGGTTLKDASGAHYSPYVRRDGKGQINIYRINGEETTLKFWIPDEYLASNSSTTSESTQNRISASPQKNILGVEKESSQLGANFYVMQVIYAHPYTFSSLTLGLTSGFFLIALATKSSPNPALSYLITSVILTFSSVYFSNIFRFHFLKKPLPFMPAIGITGIGCLVWLIFTAGNLSVNNYYLWIMLFLSLRVIYVTMRFTPENENIESSSTDNQKPN